MATNNKQVSDVLTWLTSNGKPTTVTMLAGIIYLVWLVASKVSEIENRADNNLILLNSRIESLERYGSPSKVSKESMKAWADSLAFRNPTISVPPFN